MKRWRGWRGREVNVGGGEERSAETRIGERERERERERKRA